MSELNAILSRIADALERLAPPLPAPIDPRQHRHMYWNGSRLQAVVAAPALPLNRFVGIEAQVAAVRANLAALAAGLGAHDMLLWGARGMGKSALIRAATADVGEPLHLIEVGARDIASLPALFALLPREGAYLIYVDDLVMAPGDDAARMLRSLLDGGIAARPVNARLAVTSNHRHLLVRRPTDSSEVRHARDEADDQLALADRFGLTLGFHAAVQEEYLEMVRRHAAAAGVAWSERDALEFAATRGSRSGRTAWHFVVGLTAR